MELIAERLNGAGLSLEQLEQVIRDTMAISTAEVRYDARKQPVRIRINYYDNTFVVTEMSLDKTGLILTIDPQF